MYKTTEEIFENLINSISELIEVQSIGLSSSKTPLPKSGESDIDVFIYCDAIPATKDRQSMIYKLGVQMQNVKFNVLEGGHWGIGDFVCINGVETWLMYFTVSETVSDIESILNGDYPDKLDNYYYPIGRLAMLKNINILLDKNEFLNSIKKRLSLYPDRLADIFVKYHMDMLEDTEDIERAVNRKDVLFYHFALDLAIDHFLQALFALNKTYFPSRKRSLNYIEKFKVKTSNCSENLLKVIRLGGNHEKLDESYELWVSMVNELTELYNK